MEKLTPRADIDKVSDNGHSQTAIPKVEIAEVVVDDAPTVDELVERDLERLRPTSGLNNGQWERLGQRPFATSLTQFGRRRSVT
jgi:hypothetical protein